VSLGSPSPRSPLVLALVISSPLLADDLFLDSDPLPQVLTDWSDIPLAMEDELRDIPSLSDSLRLVSGLNYRYDRADSETYFDGTLDDTTWRAFGQFDQEHTRSRELGYHFEPTGVLQQRLDNQPTTFVDNNCDQRRVMYFSAQMVF
jgi:hypothetical protein